MKKIYLYIMICALALVAFIIKTKGTNQASDEYVTKEEMAFFLSFTNYSSEEWLEVLEDKIGNIVTYEDVDTILELLGIIKFLDNPYKDMTGKINIREWMTCYNEITALLDTAKKYKTTNTKIVSIGEGYIETENGKYSYVRDTTKFNNGDSISVKHIENVAVFVEEIPDSGEKYNIGENIRVLLKNQEDGLYYNEVVFSSSMPYEVIINNNPVMCEAGIDYVINMNNYASDWSKVEIIPNLESTITFKSNGKTNTGYRGKIEVRKFDEGLVVVNELKVEEYLYGVVPGEMPASFGSEALKAQAVCARTYAYSQMQNMEYEFCEANVDDSVSFQVYNSNVENIESINAVNDTVNMIMLYNNYIPQACYFSTSCGHTTTIEAWGKDKKEDYPYLNAKANNNSNCNLDLTDEETFVNFINDKEYESYDNDSRWFRWQTSVNMDQMSEKVNTELKNILASHPEKIILENENFGNIVSVDVELRAEGGSVLKLLICEENNKITIISEYYIRKILGLVCNEVTLADGSKQSISMLPSGFFYIEKHITDNQITGYSIIGGGFGHGIGMSQFGAKGMAMADFSWSDILKFYYNGIEIANKDVLK